MDKIYRHSVEFLKNSNKKKIRLPKIAIRQSQGKPIQISNRELISYNYDGSDSLDGNWDKTGITSSDIQLHLSFYFWDPRNFTRLLSRFKEFFEIFQEFCIPSIKKTDFELIKKDFKWLFENFNPFEVKWNPWVFTMTSLQSYLEEVSYDLAEDYKAQNLGYKDGLDYFEKTKSVISYSSCKDEAKELLEKQRDLLVLEMEKDFVKVTDFLWASRQDPTNFIVDEKFLPYDLRDGWSEESFRKGIQYWFGVFFENKKVQVKI